MYFTILFWTIVISFVMFLIIASLEFVKPMGDKTIIESQTAILEAEVSLPNKQGNWKRNGNPMITGHRFHIVDGTFHRLEITLVL